MSPAIIYSEQIEVEMYAIFAAKFRHIFYKFGMNFFMQIETVLTDFRTDFAVSRRKAESSESPFFNSVIRYLKSSAES